MFNMNGFRLLVVTVAFTLVGYCESSIVLNQKVADNSEQIEGMRSIIDGLNGKINQLSSDNEILKQDADRNKELLFELRERIDKINQNYATKDDLTKLSKQSSVVAKNEKTKIDQNVDTTTSKKAKSKEEYYSEGVTLYKAKNFDEAKLNFKKSSSMKYKEAQSYYYLGECAYYTKAYSEAISNYKKSAGINDNASYMDVLLLHTAISLENTKENKQAKLFYEMVVDKYPMSASAIIAKKKLLALKAS